MNDRKAARKRPKLRKGLLKDGVEFYYSRKPFGKKSDLKAPVVKTPKAKAQKSKAC